MVIRHPASVCHPVRVLAILQQDATHTHPYTQLQLSANAPYYYGVATISRLLKIIRLFG